MRTSLLRSAWAVGALSLTLATGACNLDQPTGASPASSVRQELVNSTTAVSALSRDVALQSDVTVTAVIGRAGGTFAIPAAGLRVLVPEGAVRKPTLFTATAKAGSIVAYDFGPHGSTFNVPLRVMQDLRGTDWWLAEHPDALEGAYFADDAQLDPAAGIVTVNEFMPTHIEVGVAKLTFNVSHFSGYVIATGRKNARAF